MSQTYQVRLAFIGNSITIGTGLANPKQDCYPSQLGAMLQEKFVDTIAFDNFAVSGRTMIKKGDFPIWDETYFDDFINYGQNLCFILMGTIDSKPQNWDYYGDEFISDYLDLIDSVKSRNPYCKFIICYPPPAYQVGWGIHNSVIVNEVIPAIDSIQELTGAEVVDFYHPLTDSVKLFPDFIHPNATGAKAMAKIAYSKIIESDIIHQVETGFTFITSFKTNKVEMSKGDSATIVC
jgi:acyl-CoA thioesterase I